MMKYKVIFLGVIFLSVIHNVYADSNIMLELENQFNGGQCLYMVGTQNQFIGTKNSNLTELCEKRKISFLEQIGLETIRNQDVVCKIWSIQCFGLTENKDSIPLLISGLKKYPNVETCDGLLAIRTEIVNVLAKIGDNRAIFPLQEYIKSKPSAILSQTAMGCQPPLEPIEPAIKAIEIIKSRSLHQ